MGIGTQLDRCPEHPARCVTGSGVGGKWGGVRRGSASPQMAGKSAPKCPCLEEGTGERKWGGGGEGYHATLLIVGFFCIAARRDRRTLHGNRQADKHQEKPHTRQMLFQKIRNAKICFLEFERPALVLADVTGMAA